MILELTYDKLGSRLRSIGPIAIDYDKLGSRIATVGAFRVEYDRMGNRPRRLRTSAALDQVDDATLALLFFVLVVIEADAD